MVDEGSKIVVLETTIIARTMAELQETETAIIEIAIT
jgi:hypothetical protein